jgi:hypothetical protein
VQPTRVEVSVVLFLDLLAVDDLYLVKLCTSGFDPISGGRSPIDLNGTLILWLLLRAEDLHFGMERWAVRSQGNGALGLVQNRLKRSLLIGLTPKNAGGS